MPINIEEVIERAFEQAFSRALDQTIDAKAYALIKKALNNGSDLSRRLEAAIEDVFQRFVIEADRLRELLAR